MILDARPLQLVKLRLYVRAAWRPQNFRTQIGIHCVHRHEQRRQMKFFYAAEVFRRQIRQRDEISEQETQPIIVVLD